MSAVAFCDEFGRAENTMRISVIIVNYDSPEETRRCIDSLLSGSCQPYEIIVVNNGHAVFKTSQQSSFSAEVSTIQVENRGFGAGVNAGFAVSTGDQILISNPDMIYDHHCLQTMSEFLEETDEAGCCGPCITYPDGTIQHSARRFPSVRTFFFHRTSFLSKLFPGNKLSRQYLEGASEEMVTTVDWLAGCSILVKRSAYQATGGFDEKYFLFMEDVDFCKSLWESNTWKVFYLRSARANHKLGVSNDTSIEIIRHRHNSIRHYIRKHFTHYPWPIRKLALAAATFREKTLTWRRRDN
jgi:N-acetylglucosaminyl-diphospho-decaprenol L-rhamnosyltransferase